MTDNAIGDAGASVIAEALKLNTTITLVDLRRELAHARRLWRLTRVLLFALTCVAGNAIGDAGATKVAEALKLRAIVTSVVLRGLPHALIGVILLMCLAHLMRRCAQVTV